jgi:hypothetical protein
MAEHPQGDIIGNRYYIDGAIASQASNGAGAKEFSLGPFPWNARVRTVNLIPTGADVDLSTATSSASYRQFVLYNGGTAGTVTLTASQIASLDMTTSLASYASRVFGTINTAVSLASGEMMYLSQLTVGADKANGTVVSAGRVTIEYEII